MPTAAANQQAGENTAKLLFKNAIYTELTVAFIIIMAAAAVMAKLETKRGKIL